MVKRSILNQNQKSLEFIFDDQKSETLLLFVTSFGFDYLPSSPATLSSSSESSFHTVDAICPSFLHRNRRDLLFFTSFGCDYSSIIFGDSLLFVRIFPPLRRCHLFSSIYFFLFYGRLFSQLLFSVLFGFY